MNEEHPDSLRAAGIDPQLLEALRRGAIAPLRLSPLTYANAVSLRMRLYRLKRKLMETSHKDAPLCHLITIRLYPMPKTLHFEVMIAPRSLGFEEAFANAGLTIEEPPALD